VSIYGRHVGIEWALNQPKWEQIAAVIRQRIADGTYAPDTLVPSEHKIVQEFDVARGTARKVLQRLQEEGVIYSVRGLGNFVGKRPETASEG
jgi:GntR family transcriptional regulator